MQVQKQGMDELPDGVTPAYLGGKHSGTEDSGLAAEDGGLATGFKGKAPGSRVRNLPQAVGKAGAR